MTIVASFSKKYALKIKILSPRVYPFSKMTVKWQFCKSPKFNLHHLRKISTEFKMAVLTLKSSIITVAAIAVVKSVDRLLRKMFSQP